MCPAMRFVMLWGIELKVGMGVGEGPTRFVGIFLKQPHLGSNVIQGSICLRNTLWLPNLVRRTPDQSVVHCWGPRSCRGHLGSTRVILLRNATWPPNLVGRIPDQGIMHCLGQRSCRGQLGSSRGQFTYQCPIATKFGGKKPWPERNALLGSKFMSGSAGIK